MAAVEPRASATLLPRDCETPQETKVVSVTTRRHCRCQCQQCRSHRHETSLAFVAAACSIALVVSPMNLSHSCHPCARNQRNTLTADRAKEISTSCFPHVCFADFGSGDKAAKFERAIALTQLSLRTKRIAPCQFKSVKSCMFHTFFATLGPKLDGAASHDRTDREHCTCT